MTWAGVKSAPRVFSIDNGEPQLGPVGVPIVVTHVIIIIIKKKTKYDV